MPDYPNSAIELHDSQLGSLIQDGDAVSLFLTPAFIHRSAGRPGWDDGIGEIQECVLVFSTAQVNGDPGSLPAVILDGELRIGDETQMNLLALPCNIEGRLMELKLHLSPDYRALTITGTSLHISLRGEAEYVERFSSSQGPY